MEQQYRYSDKAIDINSLTTSTWLMKCVRCASENITLEPVGITYQETLQQHDDIRSPRIKNYYYRLPTKYEALVICLAEENVNVSQLNINRNPSMHVLVHCVDCKNTTKGLWNTTPAISGEQPKLSINLSAFKRKFGNNESGSFMRLEVNHA